MVCRWVTVDVETFKLANPQVHWLWEHEASQVLMEEVEAETAKVWKFIIDREIEAPERFRSIQSYRCDSAPCRTSAIVLSMTLLSLAAAVPEPMCIQKCHTKLCFMHGSCPQRSCWCGRAAMAVLRQQLVFVERLAHSGMVTEQVHGVVMQGTLVIVLNWNTSALLCAAHFQQARWRRPQQAEPAGSFISRISALCDGGLLGCIMQEGSLMAEPVDTAIRVLAHRGPTWRAPLVIDVLRSLPIMRQVRTAPGVPRVLPACMSTLSRGSLSAGRALGFLDEHDASHTGTPAQVCRANPVELGFLLCNGGFVCFVCIAQCVAAQRGL